MSNASGWFESILLLSIFIGALLVVIISFDVNYGQDNAPQVASINLNNTRQSIINYQERSQQQLTGGEVSFDSTQGISLKQSYGIILDAVNLVWAFLSGGFIENAVNMINLGESGTYLAFGLRVLWFVGLIFAILYGLFKVVL